MPTLDCISIPASWNAVATFIALSRISVFMGSLNMSSLLGIWPECTSTPVGRPRPIEIVSTGPTWNTYAVERTIVLEQRHKLLDVLYHLGLVLQELEQLLLLREHGLEVRVFICLPARCGRE